MVNIPSIRSMEIFKTGIRLCHRSLIVISTCRTIGLSYRAVFQPRGLIVGAGEERGKESLDLALSSTVPGLVPAMMLNSRRKVGER